MLLLIREPVGPRLGEQRRPSLDAYFARAPTWTNNVLKLMAQRNLEKEPQEPSFFHIQDFWYELAMVPSLGPSGLPDLSELPRAMVDLGGAKSKCR